VMRRAPAPRLVESASDRIVRHGKGAGRARASGVRLVERALGEVERRGGGVRLEVRSRPVALERVAPRGNLPLERDLGKRRGSGKRDRYAPARGANVAHVDAPGERGDPQAGERAAPAVEREQLA